MVHVTLPKLGSPDCSLFPPGTLAAVLGCCATLAGTMRRLTRSQIQPTRRTFLGLGAVLSCRSAGGAQVAARPRLGINLAAPDDFGSELPFADVFRCSREWISQRENAEWGKGPPLELDAHGWVKRLERGASADAAMMMGIEGHVPGGVYTALHEGQGRITMRGEGVRVLDSQPGRLTAQVPPSCDGLFLRVEETNPRNYVRNIRVLRPGTEATYRQNPWHSAFLDRWRGMAALRFMDLQRTNDSKLRRWADRPLPDDATYSPKGVPLELLVDLANRLDADPWFCVPHLADDDFVHRFATLVRDRLNPRRIAWVEYSNEVWNGSFSQHRHAEAQGQSRRLGGDPFEGALHFTASRSAEIFQICEQVFGGTRRLCRVVPGWAGNAEASAKVLRYRDCGRRADVLAVAPYLSLTPGPEGDPPTAPTVAGWTLDRLFEHLERKVLPESITEMKESRQAADRYGLRLVAYEGGQHLVGVQGAENDKTLTRLFHAANADRRMGELYRRYLAAWVEAGGDLFCHYSSVVPWSKWGSWGLLPYHDQPPRSSPKFMATMAWGRSLGQRLSGPE
jgi:hypothetical protein